MAIKISEQMVKYLEYLSGEHKSIHVQRFADSVATAFQILAEEPPETRAIVAAWLCEESPSTVITRAELDRIKNAIPLPPGPDTLDDRTREMPMSMLVPLRDKSAPPIEEKKGKKK